jgi:hypothetical protein
MSEDDVAAALRALLATVDRVPENALRAANAAIGWRDLDADLARLTAESGLELSHLRGGQPRLLTFRSGQSIVELEVSSVGGVARLLGQLDPPREAAVTIQSAAADESAAAETRTTRADSHGRFSVADLSAVWMRVVVIPADEGDERLATEWFRA